MRLVIRRKNWARWLTLAAVVVLPLLSLHFWWEGWHNSPAQENAVVARMVRDPNTPARERRWLRQWPGFLAASAADRTHANTLAIVLKTPGWIYLGAVEAQKKITIVILTFTAFAALLCAWLWLSIIRATETGIQFSRRSLVPWADIRQIDVTRWQDEGIITLTFAKSGRTEMMTISSRSWDDLTTLLAAVDQHATTAQVIQPGRSAQ
ncbi:MAG: hypothetical protein M0Z50_01400 [Planctomycetia bacterium]|nr:hypothetical protein [Planctomycetia bacterium]